MNPHREQMPRRSIRLSDAALRAEEAERARPLAVRLADRRLVKRLLLALAALEVANSILLIVQDSRPDAQPEFSPWVTSAVRLVLSAAIYLFCYRGARFAWWLAWARIAVGTVAVALSLSVSFDEVSLAFGLAFLAFGVVLVVHPRVVAFRKDCRSRRPFA